MVRGQQLPGVLVDGTLQLGLELGKAVQKDVLFVIGQVQSLGRRIGEERVLSDVLSQRCAPYQVGMEQYAPWPRA